VVYITGAVNEPGVYQLPPDARVTDVVFAAGGLKGEAAGEYINLAAPIEDAQHIHVPRREDLRQQRVSSPGASYASSSFPTTSPPSANAAAHTTSYQWGQGNGGHEETSTDRININYASERELQELQGVGEVIAKRIIDYRTINGPFRSIDDLAHVRGIGSSLIENNQASLTVGVVEDGEKGQ
jgi:competence protein ComEA